MEFISGIWNHAGTFILVLTVLVFVHELGHYLVARWCGVDVEVFSIGFGPEIVGWNDKHGTRWKISWVPLGGYVKFQGDANPASMPDSAQEPEEMDRTGHFHSKPLAARAAVVVAGPLANFLFAVVVFAIMFMVVGQPFTPPVIDRVAPDSAAAEAGFQPGDRIVEIDGLKIERFEEIQNVVRFNPETRLEFVVERATGLVTLPVTPRLLELTDRFGNLHKIGLLGVGRSGGVELVTHGPATALWYAGRETVHVSIATLKSVGQMIMGTRAADDLRGPVGIVELSGQAASIGLLSIIHFLAILSISLGLINLFPVPMLDGGHLLFYAYEAVRGKPLKQEAQEFGFKIGLALVAGLLLFTTWNDLARLPFFEFISNLFS